jgi:hypothetical protein
VRVLRVMTYFMVVSRADFPLYEFELSAPAKARASRRCMPCRSSHPR